MAASNGYILFEDSVRIVIATGFTRASANAKTGSMIQIWILVKAENPLDAIKSGSDVAVCGDCPLRGTLGKGRACYVNLGQAPLAVWRAWQRGTYQTLAANSPDYDLLFTGRAVRFGAYGDPVFIPFEIVSRIAGFAKKHTGYTHQWQNPLYSAYKRFVMASADSAALGTLARSQGWRTFRVTPVGQLVLDAAEIVCANTTKGISCEQCGLCNGSQIGRAAVKSIAIEAHGAGKVHIG